MKKTWICLAVLLWPTWAMGEAEVVQGGVFAFSVDKTATVVPVKVHALGKIWPCSKQQEHVRCWIGIDLKSKPDHYAIDWVDEQGKTYTNKNTFDVKEGEFRISHIEVKKSMASFDTASLKRLRADQMALKSTYVLKTDLPTPDLEHAIVPVQGITSTPFGAQRYVNGEPRSPHSGIDIAAPEGTPVVAPLAGKVVLVESMFLNGNTVVLAHGANVVSVFSHLKQADVQLGDMLQQGDVLGQVGQTGRATGPHLHWGVRFNQSRIDPLALLN